MFEIKCNQVKNLPISKSKMKLNWVASQIVHYTSLWTHNPHSDTWWRLHSAVERFFFITDSEEKWIWIQISPVKNIFRGYKSLKTRVRVHLQTGWWPNILLAKCTKLVESLQKRCRWKYSKYWCYKGILQGGKIQMHNTLQICMCGKL